VVKGSGHHDGGVFTASRGDLNEVTTAKTSGLTNNAVRTMRTA
jgi:hypothetical protein